MIQNHWQRLKVREMVKSIVFIEPRYLKLSNWFKIFFWNFRPIFNIILYKIILFLYKKYVYISYIQWYGISCIIQREGVTRLSGQV